ncbi:MAG: hypothetical protein ACRCW9_06380 [Cetobacterium sp.]
MQKIESESGKEFPERIKEEIINSFLIFEKEPELLYKYNLMGTKAIIKFDGQQPKKPIKVIYNNNSNKSYTVEYMDGEKEKVTKKISIGFKNLNFNDLFKLFKEIK